MRIFLTLFLFYSFLLRSEAQCLYTLKLTDSAADGWDIGFLTVSINGNEEVYTLNGIDDDGASKDILITVNTGDLLTLTWNDAFFNGEVGITLLDGEDISLLSTADPDAGLLFTHTVACPSCVRPSGVFLENGFATSAKLRWNTVLNATKYRVIYGPKGFASGEGDTLFSNTPKATITGLEEMKEYSYYVTTICPAQDTSLTSGPFQFKTYWSDDLAVTGIDFNPANCGLGVVAPSFQLTNLGANPQTLFNYYFSVNGVAANVNPPADGLWTGVVGKDSTITIFFETTSDFQQSGEYEVCVNVVMASSATDDNPANDSFCKRFTNNLTAPYSQNFETWDGGWQSQNALPDEPASWQYGTPEAAFINKAASGQKAWVTNLKGNYENNELSYLISPCYDFSTLAPNETPAFFCNIIHNLEEDFDYVALEMSTNGGNTWTTVGNTGTGLNWYTDVIDGKPVWSGISQGWIPTRNLLTGAQGNDSVMVRFVFNSDLGGALEGFGVDNVQISVPQMNDLAAVAVSTTAELSDCGSTTDSIRVTVANFGLAPQSGYTIQYSLNGGAPVSQLVPQALLVNATATITFAAPFNSTGGLSVITVQVLNTGDQVISNNTFNYTIDHSPQSLPFVENFENGLPLGWTVTNNSLITQGHGNVSNVLAFNLYEDDPAFQQETVSYGPVVAGDSLTYQYRVVDFFSLDPIALASNSLRVQVSTDCGTNYTTLDLVNGTNHTPSSTMTQRAIDLTPLAGQSVKIRFIGQHASGDFWLDLDHIGIRAKAVSVDPDILGGNLRLYPNPTSGVVTLKGSTSEATELSVTLLAVTGNLLYQAPQMASGSFNHQIDLTNYPPGVYFVQLSDGRRSQTLKLIKAGN